MNSEFSVIERPESPNQTLLNVSLVNTRLPQTCFVSTKLRTIRSV